MSRKPRERFEIRAVIVAVATLALLFCGLSHASQKHAGSVPGSGQSLMKQNDCRSCHAIDHKLVGPAFIDVANKYAGQLGVVERLSQKIRMGGSGTWGSVAMPAHPHLTDAQLSEMITWILSLRGKALASNPVSHRSDYAYTLQDGRTVRLDFPLFEVGSAHSVTKDVFKGYELYNSYCYRCHGQDVTGSEIAPDLRHTLKNGMTRHQFLSVAMAGRAAKGMPSWAGFFTVKEIGQVYEYVKGRSLDLLPVGRPQSATD